MFMAHLLRYDSLADILAQWEELHDLALLRQQQSRDLCTLLKDVTSVQDTLEDLAEKVKVTGYEDVEQLEHAITAMQVKLREV